MGCGCRKSNYPKKRSSDFYKSKISSRSIKKIKNKMSMASTVVEKRELICNQCNHKTIYKDNKICSKSNKPISHIVKDKNFSCPINKFLKC